MNHGLDQLCLLFVVGLIVFLVYYRSPFRPNLSAHGVARWAELPDLRRANMLGGDGLPVGRGLDSGTLIRLNDLVHVLLVGGAGAGKGVGVLLPALLSWLRSSVVCFDTKGDLHRASSRWRAEQGQRIIRLAPWNGGTDGYNVLDDVPADSPLLVDRCKAIAAALVVRSGAEPDAHWLDKAEQIIGALLVLVCLRFEGAERSLNSVQDIASCPHLLAQAAVRLKEVGDVAERMGNHVEALFAPPENGALPQLSREGSGIMSTVARALGFLDSELVARAVARSTFRAADLLQPGVTLFIQVPPDLLEAQRGLLRCWIAGLIRAVSRDGDETRGEVLFLLDEASALGGLAGLREALVRGRSAGARVLLAYQSDSQVRAAFRDEPTVIYDNCAAQLYLCPPSGYETAEKISKACGDFTQVLESANSGTSRSYQEGGHVQQGGPQVSHSDGRNLSVAGRNLLRPEEVLNLPPDRLVAFVRGLGAPLLCRRLSYFNDPLFAGSPQGAWPTLWCLWWSLAAAAVALAAWGAGLLP